MSEHNGEATTFAELGLTPELLRVLDKLSFVTPTPIQAQSIPVGMDGDDIIGIAQTGTGKTLAFGLPILNRYILNGNRSRGRALILLPTRELALQVEETLKKVGTSFGLRTAVLIGGAPIRQQIAELRRDPDVIVATPGRLIDHLQQRTVDLRTVDTLVLDEADRMLDMGFAPQIRQILKAVPDERQTLLYSATMPSEIVDIAANYMADPVRVEVARAGKAADDVTQELFVVPQDDKNELLAKLMYEYKGTILVFARTRSRASRVSRWLNRAGHNAAEIHSDRTLTQRRAALDGFKDGKYRILVATDIAARGIDVTGIELVLNYDLPDSAEDYVHRIGRTGRAGMSGHAISFAAPDQAADVREIEKLIQTAIQVAAGSEHQLEAATSKSRAKRGRGGSSTPGGSGQGMRPRSQGQSQGGGRGEYRGGGDGRSSEGRSSAPRADGSAPAVEPRQPQGLHYSDANYQRPSRTLQRGGRSFSGRSSARKPS